MRKIKLTAALLAVMIAGSACSGDDSSSGVDQTKPTISTEISGGFPTSCATVARGSVISFKALFADNQELGAYSINIHQNFDHHSHDTETDACELDAVKTPVNAWSETLAFTIPSGQQEFLAEQQIQVPADIDTGDYHFMVQLTDASGWAALKGISIKITD